MDKLCIEKISNLVHPIRAKFYGGKIWEIHNIDVCTGLMRIIVCGLPEIRHFEYVSLIIDGFDNEYPSDIFYKETI